jgi:hypothetical protein
LETQNLKRNEVSTIYQSDPMFHVQEDQSQTGQTQNGKDAPEDNDGQVDDEPSNHTSNKDKDDIEMDDGTSGGENEDGLEK